MTPQFRPLTREDIAGGAQTMTPAEIEAWKQAASSGPPPPFTHGTFFAYDVHRCRCDECKARVNPVAGKRRRAWYARKRAARQTEPIA